MIIKTYLLVMNARVLLYNEYDNYPDENVLKYLHYQKSSNMFNEHSQHENILYNAFTSTIIIQC